MLRNPELSVTHCMGVLGIDSFAALAAAQTVANSTRLRTTASSAATRLQFYLRGGLRPGRRREVRFFVVAASEQAGNHDSGERVARGIECLRRFIEAHALDRNAILGAFQLGLEIGEVLAGFEVGIVLRDDKKTRQGRR